jgi:ferric-dicitrate binding protein FerR (iron transport regulator)
MNDLLRKLSDGTLSTDEAKELNELLRGNPEACEIYLNHIALEAQLERELGQPRVISPVRAIRSISRYRAFAKPLLAAAAVITLSFFLWPADKEQRSIATMLLAEDCQWRSSVVNEGSRLVPGKIQLSSGTAILRFDGGAEAILRGETTLELLSAVQARLITGEVVIRAEGDAAGFKLLTPVSELTDLGTEFAVKVQRSGVTELQVLDGQVGYGDAIADAGHALRFEAGKEAEAMPVTSPRFTDLIQQAAPKERRDLMTHYDGFFYDAGTYQPSDIVKGKGWAGPWRLRQSSERRLPNEIDSTTDMRIVEGGLHVPWPIPGGKLGGLEMPAGRSFRLRPMKQGIDMAAEGITYFSLITYEPEHGKKRRTTPVEGVRLTFRSSADYWNESLSFGCQQSLRPLIQAGAQGNFASAAAIADEQSLLWIGKIIRRADGEDEVFFRIYGQADALDYAEPATWHTSTRGLRQSAVLDLVMLSSTGQSPRIVDELRIGPTWRSVVPMRMTNDK